MGQKLKIELHSISGVYEQFVKSENRVWLTENCGYFWKIIKELGQKVWKKKKDILWVLNQLEYEINSAKFEENYSHHWKLIRVMTC